MASAVQHHLGMPDGGRKLQRCISYSDCPVCGPERWETCVCGSVGTQFPARGVCGRCYFKREQPSPEFMLR